MTTFVPPQLIRTTGTLTVEDINIAAQTGNEAFLDLVTDLAAAGDIANIRLYGEDSNTNLTAYAELVAEIVDPTDTSEDGALRFSTMQAGALTEVMTIANGLTMLGATGGDQGSGTINATGIFVNGVAVSTSTGDVTGPGASTDNAIARFDGATGKIIQNSGVIIDDTNNITGVNNLTVTGDLTVNGTTTTINTAQLDVEDVLIRVGSGNNATDTVDLGIVGLYDTSGSQDLYAGIFRDASDNKWKLFVDSQEDLSAASTVNTGAAGYTIATLVANLEGNVTGVASGNVANTLYDAQSVVVAVADNTPVVQVVGDSEFVGRPAGGNVGVMTAAQARTVLNVSNGANATSMALQVYVDGVDFTAGTSNTLTLPSTPAGEAYLDVYFNGIFQESTEWSFVGTTLTFSAAIPVGVTRVEVRILSNA